MKEDNMNTEFTLSAETIEKLKKLLGCFGNHEYNTDIYSLFIKKSALEK